MADRFYTPDPLAPGEYVLTGAEAHHLVAVRRFGPGDRVVLFNGDGRDYPAEVVAADRKRSLLNILATVPTDRELPFPLEVAAALPKGDRGDFLVEKLTELGVSRFIPLQTDRSIVQPRETRLEKLQQAVIEASKQCGRNVLMRVAPLTPWSAFVASPGLPRVRPLLHPSADGTDRLATIKPDAGGVVVAIGPEGGFSPAEVAASEAAGWVRVGLGPRVLRVETAAIVAAGWFSSQ
ncbi:MAG TPA: RsmE family RNA methyltransferase [Urbifossiella sp.]|jgi:16S rRNA (uracil1498-N3)-methyltransferase|nr:RsmE family RNA methyltransferase [Urbifossiella sp.]